MKRAQGRFDFASLAGSGGLLAASGAAALALASTPAAQAEPPKRAHCRKSPGMRHHHPPAPNPGCGHGPPPQQAANGHGPKAGQPETQTPPPLPPNVGVLGSRSSQAAGAVPLNIADAAESHRRWREGSKLAHASASAVPVGTMFSFLLNEQATVALSFNQRLRGRKLRGRCVANSANRRLPVCTLGVRRGTISLSAHAGFNRLVFQGRISRARRLPPGIYAVLITATNAARQHAGPMHLSFTIIK